ncbi:hypothetical protein BABINDRAFT_164093 [Babjeviella inositovora NRRL Y-12698]|uniref:Mediator of RNA polymerase II transcription subunit 4 n=1 Tax=Babjeviella inositovora NRRL Y-12698 TaxID=984486 RepID=A0A1E3QYX0_9ASCO|nr:uncharacterized protein BABINDRAFT_164093 [Babjeviella inositovora NRRL Y-12698]ODQ82282.1 hypothetical protein BABINDRAFT_164093 [Babjeviella inositovora NRRL Y-12698]
MYRNSNTLPISRPLSTRLASPGHARTGSNVPTPALLETRYSQEVTEKLPIVQHLTEFEQKLSELVSSVQRYDPKPTLAVDLLSIDQELANDIRKLQHHQKQGQEIRVLSTELSEIDADAKNILRELVSCRNTLRNLPNIEEDEFGIKNNRPDVAAEELLEYARKLSKFSTAPATFAPGTVGPADYIWPAENMLRRGMLAIASLKIEELIKTEDESAKEEVAEVKPQEEVKASVRRDSFSADRRYDGDHAGTMEAAAIDDLDLFDPDEDDF